MVTREPGATADRVRAEPDPVLEEPEALLGVTAVVVPIRTEEENVAGRRRARAGGRVGRQGVAGGEAVEQVVLVGQAAGAILPRPLRHGLGVLGSASREDRRVEGSVVGPLDGRCPCGVGRAGALVRDDVGRIVGDRHLVAHVLPVVGASSHRVAVELEGAGGVHRVRPVDREAQRRADHRNGDAESYRRRRLRTLEKLHGPSLRSVRLSARTRFGGRDRDRARGNRAVGSPVAPRAPGDQVQPADQCIARIGHTTYARI